MHVIEVAAGDLSGFVASLGFTHLEIKGDWTGAFFNQRLFLNVWDGQDGMVGHLEYDDGDGFETSLDMICGAVNYVRTK